MDRQYIDDRQIIERYLLGTLSADEESAFEEAYLGDPEILDELILAEKLRRGLRLEGERRGGGQPRWTAPFGSPRYAAAATVLLAVSVLMSGTLYFENRGLRGDAAPSAAPVTRLLPLVSVRGDGVNVVARPGAEEWIVFLVDAGFTDYAEYRGVVSRRTASGIEPIRQLGGLVPTYDGMLPIGLPGGLLEPGDYEILIEGRMSDPGGDAGFEPIATTPLRIGAQ